MSLDRQSRTGTVRRTGAYMTFFYRSIFNEYSTCTSVLVQINPYEYYPSVQYRSIRTGTQSDCTPVYTRTLIKVATRPSTVLEYGVLIASTHSVPYLYCSSSRLQVQYSPTEY